MAPTAAPWAVMWGLAAAVYVGCKGLTWSRTPTTKAPGWRHVAYLLAWPGLDARAFLDPRRSCRRPAPRPASGCSRPASCPSGSGSPGVSSGWFRRTGRSWPGGSGWLFTAVVVVGPAYGLFHPPFVLNIFVPFLRAIGAV
jgi:hypothetical protein